MSADPAEARADVTARSDAGVAVTGRLLWVGVVSGLLIGGLVASLVSGAVDIFGIGAMVGAVAGVTAQALTAAVLAAVRRVSTGPTRASMRALLVPVPAATAVLTPLLFDASYSAAGWLVLAAGAVSAAAVAWLTSPWCLAPVIGALAGSAPIAPVGRGGPAAPS